MVMAVVVEDINGMEVVAEVTGFDVVVIAGVIDVVVDVEEDVVEVAHDANTRDTTMRQVNTIHRAFFFI
jgi:preprotein translocase subunit YajC